MTIGGSDDTTRGTSQRRGELLAEVNAHRRAHRLFGFDAVGVYALLLSSLRAHGLWATAGAGA